ncbi:hypothetical protein P8936_09235 [Edaphobacter paludis]|uniref:Uncharacterized protein n=1 Tax=Edaphobacter paludis TaxID=3035702 RepID=A0AAU7D298_9BACT
MRATHHGGGEQIFTQRPNTHLHDGTPLRRQIQLLEQELLNEMITSRQLEALQGHEIELGLLA